ncbi:hypothetical protein NKI38_25860 [Mesorhizobium sp. M0621]|uniref:class I SAM-dependent methyltransferase n=1 Tax=Mesorhizobium sp. M0621 TaxID=2956974 RepID=UPI00333A6D08
MSKHPSLKNAREGMPAGATAPKVGGKAQAVRPAKYDGSLRDLYEAHRGKVSDKWSIYLTTYDRIFSKYRNMPVRILEIGVQNGGALEIWRRYFANAELVLGCDINEACGNLVFDDKKVAVVVGDANADEIERNILGRSKEFDIIIDDGSHKSSDIIRTFARYFPHLSEGGVYITEDLHCSYWAEYEGGLYDPLSSMSFFKRLLDVVNYEHWGLDRRRTDALAAFSGRYGVAFEEASLASIHAIEFLNSLCFVSRRSIQENALGRRCVEGRVALVEQSVVPLDGTTSKAADETGSVWSLQSTTMEEEIGINRELINHHEMRMEMLSHDYETRMEMRTYEQEARIEVLSREHEARIEVLSREHEARMKALSYRIAAAHEQIRSGEEEIAQRKAESIAKAAEIHVLQEELSLARTMTSALEAKLTEHELVIQEFKDSTSWRITGPLRALSAGFGRALRNLRWN